MPEPANDDVIGSLQRSLDDTGRETHPGERARLQIQLGDAWLARAREGERLNAREAWNAYAAAAELSKANDDLDAWAMACTGLGMAWLEIASGPQGARGVLYKAAHVCREVVTRYPRERNPVIWAVAQARLARVLLRQASGSRWEETVLQAEEAIAAASAILTPDKFPAQAAALRDLTDAIARARKA